MSEKNETVEQDSTDPRDLEIEKLRAKNKELLSEKQKEKAKVQALADEKDEAEARAAESGGNVDALKAAHAKELAKLQAKLDASDGDLRTIRVDNEISKALASGNVRQELGEGFTAILKSKVQYDGAVATIDGKPIADFASEYLGSDVGSHYRRASDNSGGGATGNSSNTKAPRMTRENFNYTDFGKLMVENPAEANALADQLGRPELKSN
ncbi:hypothetical protein IFT54_05565 [Sphingomonas sp. CFBP 13714]|uniref:hypothetical protein n=1 Tax=Sphingomonas sp. CFBP 13714 TaxID=2775308 RepID=UPI00177D31ED|nr:hypothetical protein [Sphingomonas sp. CFBP 13714]MBD8699283.1 hypothetical protein [Sphingomonas sp. CFBP 13714]